MPIPGTADNVVDGRILGPPLEIATNFVGASYKHRRVAGAPRRFLLWDRMACDSAGGFDYFPNAKSLAASQIVDKLAWELRASSTMRWAIARSYRWT
jgi:hypothetical protein